MYRRRGGKGEVTKEKSRTRENELGNGTDTGCLGYHFLPTSGAKSLAIFLTFVSFLGSLNV